MSGRCLEGIYGMSEWYVSVRYQDVSEGQVRTPNFFGPKFFLHLRLVGLFFGPEIHLRMEFDSSVGPTCLRLFSYNNPYLVNLALSKSQGVLDGQC